MNNLTSDINLRELVEALKESIYDFEPEEIRDITEYWQNGENDFTVYNRYRFIHEEEIDRIQQEELLSDLYMLGCFDAHFIADILKVDVNAIHAIQKADAFEGLGQLLVPHIEDIQERYSSLDGYGHHFNPYDGTEDQVDSYFVFRIN